MASLFFSMTRVKESKLIFSPSERGGKGSPVTQLFPLNAYSSHLSDLLQATTMQKAVDK